MIRKREFIAKRVFLILEIVAICGIVFYKNNNQSKELTLYVDTDRWSDGKTYNGAHLGSSEYDEMSKLATTISISKIDSDSFVVDCCVWGETRTNIARDYCLAIGTIGACTTETPKPSSTSKPNKTPKPTSEPECIESASVIYSITAPTEVCKNDKISYFCNQNVIYSCPENWPYNYSSSTKGDIDTSVVKNVEIKCGNTKKTVKVKNCYACYRKLVEQTTDYNRYEYTWATSKPSGYEETDLSEADCNSIKNVGCQKNALAPNVSKDATSCSGTVSLPLNEKNMCSDSMTNNYYSINCTETVTSNFIPNKLKIKIGQGFKFNINLKSTKVCNGDFNKTAWDSDYNKIQNKINKTTGKEQKWYLKLRTELNNIVSEYKRLTNFYKTWNINDDTSNPEAVLKISYLSNKKNKSLEYRFQNTNKTGRVLESKNLGAINLVNGEKLEKYSVKIESGVELIPSKVYFDYQGNVTTNNKDTIDGGNYFLSDLKSDTGKYDISISISKLGTNEKGTINNNQCKLELEEDNRLYRIIDVSNPFDISTVTAGDNWSNVNYNFKDVINEKTWSESSLYVFNLSPTQIKQIKESNASFNVDKNFTGYLGLCERNVLKNDPTKEIICDVIK